jgi:DNA-binding GntR family transcriptional regulator
MRHSDIYETLKRHDVQAACEAMRTHLLELRDEMIKRIEETG